LDGWTERSEDTIAAFAPPRNRSYAETIDFTKPLSGLPEYSPPASAPGTGIRLLCRMESRGLIELRYPDGSIVTGDYDDYADKHLNRGDRFEFLEMGWVMYDRVDRRGVTVFLCRPADGDT
jgi:hypothetical protein